MNLQGLFIGVKWSSKCESAPEAHQSPVCRALKEEAGSRTGGRDRGGHEDAGKAARENVAATDGRPKGDPEQPALQMLAVPRAQVRAHARVLRVALRALFLMAARFRPCTLISLYGARRVSQLL